MYTVQIMSGPFPTKKKLEKTPIRTDLLASVPILRSSSFEDLNLAFLFWKHFWISCPSLCQACVKRFSYYFPFKICQMCNTLNIVSLHGYSLMCYLICILHVLSIYLPAFPPQYRKSPASSEKHTFFRFEANSNEKRLRTEHPNHRLL